MRFSLLTVGAFAATSLAAPALNAEKRQVSNVLQVVQGLANQITSFTGAINATLDSVSGVNAAGVDVANITATVKDQVASIVSMVDSVLDQTQDLTNVADVSSVLNIVNGLPLVGSVTGLLNGVPIVSSLTTKRQTADLSAVVSTVSGLITEVTATINRAATIVPVADLNATITPLTTSLSTLLVDVNNVLGGLTTSVTSLVNGLPLASLLNLNIAA